MSLLLGIGTDAIEQRVRQLTGRCLDRLEEIGWPSVTPRRDDRRGPMVAVPSTDSGRLSAKLMERDIVTSHRGSNLRASFHFYNTEEDVDGFIEALIENRSTLR